MHIRTLAVAASVAASLVAPAAASAHDAYADGHISAREAKAVTRAFLKSDPRVRASLFLRPIDVPQSDGSVFHSQTTDQNVLSTRFSVLSCHRVSSVEADCAAGVSAFRTAKPGKSAYRSVMFTFTVVATGKGSGSATVTAPIYMGTPIA